MEKLLVIITVSLVISIIGLQIAEFYEYEDHKKTWEAQYKKIGGKSSDLSLGRLKLDQLKEDSFSESKGRGLNLHGDDDYKYAPTEE